MTKVVNDITKGQILGFVGTLLGSLVTVSEAVGKYKGIVSSEASFRQFIASKGDNEGKKFGVLECSVTLENKSVVKCRVDSTFTGNVGDAVTVDISESESNGKTYKNAVIV